MKRKIIAIAISTIMTAVMFAGCTPDDTSEAEVTYKIVGGISEPVRVWYEVAEAPTEAAIEEEEVPTEEVAPAECPGAPEYTPSEPEVADTGCAGRYVVKEPNDKLSFTAYAGDSEKFDAIRELAGGEFVQVTGKTTKGWYALSDGSYIHSYTVEYSPEPKPQVAQTQPQTQAAPAESQPTQQEQSQPTQEQPAQQESQPTYTEPAQTEQSTQTEETSGGWNTISYEEAEAIRSTCPHTNTWTGEGCDLETGEIRTTTVCLDCGTVLN